MQYVRPLLIFTESLESQKIIEVAEACKDTLLMAWYYLVHHLHHFRPEGETMDKVRPQKEYLVAEHFYL